MKVLQINTLVNSSSPGRIAEEIGQSLLSLGHESKIGYGRGDRPSASEKLKIGTRADVMLHGVKSRLLDRHGLASTAATRKFLAGLDPAIDLVHLHNIHGYYINYKELFRFLKEKQLPVVWTFHDCWPFTGHCVYFDSANCYKWKTECHQCPKTSRYPKSLFIDNSRSNYRIKKAAFNGIDKMRIVTPSHWLKQHVKSSFLKGYSVEVIHNGVDLDTFNTLGARVNTGDGKKEILLGVASVWDERKGLNDFIELRKILPEMYEIVLIGLSEKQISALPEGIKGVSRTEDVQELAAYYRSALAFINPTYQDNFPTTNIEALACGTPVITYQTGGSPEAIDENTGRLVQQADIPGLMKAVGEIHAQDPMSIQGSCRKRAESHFNKEDRYRDYIHLYEHLLATI